MNDFTFGYREVVPDQTVPDKWKEISLNTGGTQSTLQDIKVAERAGGYSFKDASKYYTRNRFIYWRISHDVLELIEQSLDLNLVSSRLRYRFTDTPILDGITIHETYGAVFILVPTVCSVHCLTFPHPDRLHKQNEILGFHPDLTVPSIFSDTTVSAARDSNTYHVINNNFSSTASLPHAAASWLNKMDGEAVFVLAYSTGTLLHLRLSPSTGQCISAELKQDSTVPRFLSGFAGAWRSKTTDGQVAVSMMLHSVNAEIYLFILCRDGHLRVWSCTKGSCIGAIDVLADTADSGTLLSQGAQSHVLRKSVDSDTQQLTVGIFLCFAAKCQFHVLRPTLDGDNFRFVRLCSMYAPEQDLIDFSLDDERLWAVWRGHQGESSVSSCSLQRPGSALWMPAVLESPPPGEYIPSDPSIDSRQAYCDYIFYPGRFPFTVITKALSIYRRSAVLSDMTISPTALKQHVCMAVEAEIQTEVMEYELSDDDYLEIANRCWSRFYSCCAQYCAAGARPLGILLLPAVSGVALLRKATLSLLRPMDILEHLVLCQEYSNANELAAGQLLSNDVYICKDILSLMSILVMIEKHLTDEVKMNINSELRNLRSPDKVVAELVEELLPGGDDCALPSEVVWDLCRKASALQDLYHVMHLLLEALRLDKAYPSLTKTSPSEQHTHQKLVQTVEHLYSSPLGISFISESVHQISKIRFLICRNLLVLQHILLEGRQQEWTILEAVRSVCMPDTVVFTQAYFTGLWLCEVIATPITLLESHQQRLSILRLNSVTNISRATMQQPFTLLQLFVYGAGGSYAHKQLCRLQLKTDELPHWHVSLLTYVDLLCQLIWPVSGTLTLGEWLLASGQHILLQQYVRQLSHWCEWNNCSRQFLLAVALLEMGERHKALDLFQYAANGIFSDEFLPEKTLPITGPSSESSALVEYYLKVIALLEQHNAYDCAINIAQTAISRANKEDPHLATLHSIIFVHHLALEHFEEAYHSLAANPDQGRKKDCLRQLVGTLLEKRKLDTLVSFPYVKMSQDFENIVMSRARAMDLANNYLYDFLYSFYIQKSNFRRAGTIMYEQALRLNQINAPWAMEQQAKSYLACINALSLVDENFQWVVRPRALINNCPDTDEVKIYPIAGSGKEIKEFKLNRDIETLSLEDIRKELEHVRARIHLTKIDPNIHISPDSSPNELTALLANVGMFRAAVSLCTSYKLPYGPVLKELAMRCVRHCDKDTTDAWIWLENNIGELSVSETNPSAVYWLMLENFINKYEQQGSTVLHKVVAERIITLGAFLPHWLQSSYKIRNASELIILYQRSNRLVEATEIAVDYLLAAVGKGKEYFGLKGSVSPINPALCLPINTIISLIYQLKRIVQVDKEYEKYYEKLLEKLLNYKMVCKQVSNDMEKISWQKVQS